jgi:uncharacterized membrane protein
MGRVDIRDGWNSMIRDITLLVTLAIIWIIPATLVARAAERRGRRFGIFLIVALLVPWPIILLVVVVVLPHGSEHWSEDRADGR